MKNYKTTDNTKQSGFSLHVIESEFAYLLPAGCIEITDEEATAIRLANIPSTQVPKSVTMRQGRLALLNAGLLQTVNSTIAAMTGAAGDAARIEWEFSSEIQRDKELVLSLMPIIGLTESQMDQLFISASKL